jgi:hypothetical protein
MNKLYAYENGKRIRVLKDVECPVCKIIFSPEINGRKYCGRKCYYEMKRTRKDRVSWTQEMRDRMSNNYKGSGNPMFGIPSAKKGKKRPEFSGERHPLWKGGFSINQGYKVMESIYTNGQKVPEHRKILEQKIGRKLKKNEVTHHINRNKLDNRPENLMVMTRAEHINYHRKDLNK